MWLISSLLEPRVLFSGTIACCFSDHNGIVLKLSNCVTERGPGRWQMNAQVLQSDIFKNNFGTLWRNWQRKKVNYPDLRDWWDEGKNKIKEFAIYCCKHLRNSQRANIRSMEQELLECQNNTVLDVDRVNNLKEQLQSLYQTETEGCKLRAKVTWAEEGETSSGYFHSLEKKNAVDKMWTSIKDRDGSVKTGIDNILARQVEYYADLYTAQGMDAHSANVLLNNIEPSLTVENRDFCDLEISYDDCEKAVKHCKVGKSPGIDGITNDFYKTYWGVIGQDFVELVNYMWEKQELCDSQYVGLIRLLFKKGEREDITNWRPITLLNCDYKIIEKVLANRLSSVIPEVIKEDQKGFVKGRHIEENVRLVEDVIDYCEENNIPGAIMCIDQSKAFDRVEWEWLDRTLEVIGFGPKFRMWIKILYKNANSCILTNGFVSKSFKIARGVRQGSPLGPFLYILQSEILAEYIRTNPDIKGIVLHHGEQTVEIKLSTFADDAQAYIGDQKSVGSWFKTLKLYGRASGAKVNKDKTQGMLLGPMKRLRYINQDIVWSDNIDVLGFCLSINRDRKEYWDTKLAKVEKLLKVWSRRKLTLRGKVYLIRCYGINVLQYCMSAITVPDNVITYLESLFWKFLWDNGREKAKRHVCMRNVEEGGLGMPNVRNLIMAQRIKFLCRLLGEGNEKWKFLPRMYLMKYDVDYGEKYYSLKCIHNVDISMMPLYYKECVQAYHILKLKELEPINKVDILGQYIWGNQWIKILGRGLHDKIWCKKGIIYVKDLFTKEGELKEQHIFDLLQNRAQNFVKLYSYVSAIPGRWKAVLRTGEHVNIGSVRYQPILTLSLKDGTINLENCKIREIYNLLASDVVKSNAEQSWEAVLGPIDWSVVYQVQQCSLLERKVRDFRWKVINKCLTTEAKLKHFTDSNGVCKLCELETEDEMHILSDCVSLDNFWSHIVSLLRRIAEVNVQVQDTLFICGVENNDLVNVIIEEAKWQVWKRRCLIRYENVWIDDVQLLRRLRTHLQVRTDVLKLMKNKNPLILNKLDLFWHSL